MNTVSTTSARRFDIRRQLSGLKDERGIAIRARTIAACNGATRWKEEIADLATKAFREGKSAEEALDAARAEAKRLVEQNDSDCLI